MNIATSWSESVRNHISRDTRMGCINFEQVQIPIRSAQSPRSFVVRTPKFLTTDPALLINLGSDVANTLDAPIHRIASDMFLGAGHRAASFDLPCHGEWKNAHGHSLPGMAAAIAAGEDLFAQIAEVGKDLVNACIEQQLARPGQVVICGISRGGLAALHVFAGDERISAAALFAPVTHLAALPEDVGFRRIAEMPLVQKSNAMALVDRVAARPVAVSITTTDPAVSTEHCLRFHAALCAAAPLVVHRLHMMPGDTHRMPDAGYHSGAAFLLSHCARTSRT
jgi:hypothetical protein